MEQDTYKRGNEMTKKEQFLSEFDNPENGQIQVYIDFPNCPVYELTVNTKANFEAKREYYDLSYNDDLELIAFTDVKIAKYSAFSDDLSFEEALIKHVEGHEHEVEIE